MYYSIYRQKCGTLAGYLHQCQYVCTLYYMSCQFMLFVCAAHKHIFMHVLVMSSIVVSYLLSLMCGCAALAVCHLVCM